MTPPNIVNKQSLKVFRDHLQRAKHNLNLALDSPVSNLQEMVSIKELIIRMKTGLDGLISIADEVMKES